MSLSQHLQGFLNKEDSTSFQHETSKRPGEDAPKLAIAAKPAKRPKPERSDTINSITVLVKATLGISEHTDSILNRSQPSKPVVLVDRIVLVSICIVVALGFCVPIIIYAVDTNKGGDNPTTITLDFDVDQCSSVTTNTTYQSGNGISTQSLYTEACTSYSGQCSQYLEEGLYDTTSLFTLTLKGISENDIAQFMAVINQFMGTSIVSEQCAEVVLPFLCQYLHPPCDGNGSVNLISREQCSNIRDVVCADEWRLVMATSSSSLLPVCEHFSDAGNITDDNTTPQPLQCHYQFKEYCGLCLPLCGEFSQYRVKTKFQERAIFIFAGALAFIGGLLVFIATIIRWKALLDFPSVLVVYNTICAFVVACLVLITYIGGQERLYCTHEVLSVTYDNPSTFCQASGFLYHWMFVLLGILWMLHLIHLFIKIAFPVWSRKLTIKRTKIILHVTEVAGAIFVSIVAPIVFMLISEYNIGRFPPVLCLPSSKVYFYTVCLPLCIAMAFGVILAVVMLWILRERHQIFRKKSTKYLCSVAFNVPEIKILFLSSYFVIFGVIALVNISIGIRDSDIILDKLFVYFTCQAAGYHGPDTCAKERDDLESHLKPELNAATYILLGLVPWSNLLFAIQVKDVKKALQRLTAYRYHVVQDRSVTISKDSTQAISISYGDMK